jgi:hypothetical protein
MYSLSSISNINQMRLLVATASKWKILYKWYQVCPQFPKALSQMIQPPSVHGKDNPQNVKPVSSQTPGSFIDIPSVPVQPANKNKSTKKRSRLLKGPSQGNR